MLLFVDNVDSFTYNLVHLLQVVGAKVCVIRNDALATREALSLHPTHIVIGPGPGTPQDAGISKELIQCALSQGIPLLGICLGHQCIGEVLGAHTVRALRPVHGKVQPVHHTGEGLFAGLSSPLACTRYHSLLLERATILPPLRVDAWTETGEVMAIRHATAPAYGVQFHPEAALSEGGAHLLTRFLETR